MIGLMTNPNPADIVLTEELPEATLGTNTDFAIRVGSQVLLALPYVEDRVWTSLDVIATVLALNRDTITVTLLDPELVAVFGPVVEVPRCTHPGWEADFGTLKVLASGS